MRVPNAFRRLGRLRSRGTATRHRRIPALVELEARSLLSLTIQIDYSLDKSGFFTSSVRSLFQQAAAAISADITTNLKAIIPSGSNTWTASFAADEGGFVYPEHDIDNLVVPANTIIVYAIGTNLPGDLTGGEAGLAIAGGGSATSGTGSNDWANAVFGRGLPGALASTPTQNAPWGGAIFFDTGSTKWFFGKTTAGIKSNQTDFLTVAEHELAHVLGFGTAGFWISPGNIGIPGSWATNVNPANHTFIGKTAMAANGGKPVPLDVLSADQHFAEGQTYGGEPVTMEPVLTDGQRNELTTLDFAAIQDIGWQMQAPVVQFDSSSMPSVSVLQTKSSVTLTVVRTGGQGPAVVHYATSDGTAKNGVDYKATSGTLEFAVGQKSATITIPILNNPNSSGDATFTVKLSNPNAFAVLGSATTTTVRITNTLVPKAPVLATSSDTGVSHSDGITMNNGSASAPLVFSVSGVTPANGFVRLYSGSTLLAGPVQASGGTAVITLNSQALADGVYPITATGASTATSAQSSPSNATKVTIQTSLKLVNITPVDGNYRTLLNNQVVVTFSHPLAGFTADVASGSGVSNNPSAVTVTPRGPDGAFLPTKAPDMGSLPIHATTVYHVNSDGKSTLTLTPRVPLGTDVYLITVAGNLTDLAGNRITRSDGTTRPQYSTFTLRTAPPSDSPLKIVSITTLHASVNINNNTIPQPDTIAIGFKKPVDFLTTATTATTSPVQLLAGPSNTQVPAAVAYSPSTKSVYLTPEAILSPGVTYTIQVDGSVTDDQGFPSPDTAYTLGSTFKTTFQVSSAGVGAGSGPLTVVSRNGQLAVAPAPGSTLKAPFGYASIPFSEAVDLASLGRFSVQIVPRQGGLNNSGFDTADRPLNAKIAFNPNLNTMIVVPTVPVGNDSYLYSLANIKATNGDPLVNPGGTLPIYIGFSVNTALKKPSAVTHSANLWTAAFEHRSSGTEYGAVTLDQTDPSVWFEALQQLVGYRHKKSYTA